jgi:hypothetical protein
MTIKEQIAKAIILKLDSDGRRQKFFDAYDKHCNEEWFISDMVEQDNFETIIWEFGNLKDVNAPQFCLREDIWALHCEYHEKIRKELDEIINQFMQ